MSRPDLKTKSVEFRALCHKWRVKELSLFGSALRDDFGPGSDVDMLVVFEADADWSLWDVAVIQREFETLFGYPVDLVEKRALKNPYRRHRILRSCEVVYAG